MDPLTIPKYGIDAAKLLFPTLDFDRLRFYFKQGAPEPTTTAYFTHTDIVMNGSGSSWPWDPLVPKGKFVILCHELVHALQGQSFFDRIIKNAASITCAILHGQGNSPDNCVEHEAYEYENKITTWLDSGPSPFIRVLQKDLYLDLWTLNPAFVAAVAADPSLRKESAGCTPWDCAGPAWWQIVLGALISIPALIWTSASAVANGTISYIGAGVGAVSGGASGVVVGIGLLGPALGGFAGGVVGIILGGLLGAGIGLLIEGLIGLFTDDGGALHLAFSEDFGATFGNEVKIERSAEPMSLAFSDKTLTIAYTNSDNAVALLTLPYESDSKSKVHFEESEDCGPAIIVEGVRTKIVWQGTDHHLNSITSYGIKLNWDHKLTIPSKTPSDSTSSLGEMSGRAILTYIDQGLNLKIRIADQGVGWLPSFQTGEHADADCSVAVTGTRDKEFAVAWVGAEKKKRINIRRFSLNPTTGAVSFGAKFLLSETSDSGVALAFNSPLLYLAWTGTDGRVNFMVSRDFGASFVGKQIVGKGRTDCAPALAVHPDTGLICIGWTGAN